VYAAKTYTLVQTKNNQLYFSGKIGNYQKESWAKICDNARQVALNSKNILILDSSGNLQARGKNKHSHIATSDITDVKQFESIAKGTRLSKQRIVDMAVGSHYSLYATHKGELFVKGRLFLEVLQMDKSVTFERVTLPKTLSVKRVFCS